MQIGPPTTHISRTQAPTQLKTSSSSSSTDHIQHHAYWVLPLIFSVKKINSIYSHWTKIHPFIAHNTVQKSSYTESPVNSSPQTLDISISSSFLTWLQPLTLSVILFSYPTSSPLSTSPLPPLLAQLIYCETAKNMSSALDNIVKCGTDK